MRKKNLSVNMSSINPVPWLSPQPIVSNRETDHHKSIATTNVGYSLLKHSSYTHQATFTHSTNCPAPLQNIIGICYLGASSTSEQDTQQESTYLSQLLFDSDVYGIHNSDPLSNQDPFCSHAVRALLDFWDKYLSANPTRHILQCFYGDGCFAISKALEITPYKQKITVVGINSDCQINHTNAFSLQVPPSALNSNQTIRNPILSKGLLEAFYDAIAIPESTDLKTIPLSDRIEEHLLLDEDTSLENHENGANQNEWKLDRARHIFNAALACLRLGGYSFLMLRNAVINTHVSRYAKAYRQRRSITNAAGNTTSTFSSYPLTSTSQITQKSQTVTSHLATTLPTATAVPKISEADLRYIFPCGILTNGSFPGDRFPLGTYSNENPFPYAKYFNGTLTQHFNRSRDNTLPHPYGFTYQGHFLPRCSGKEVSMPYSCVSKAGQFNKTLFFGGGYINNEDPGEEIIYPCGIRPNGTFTGQYLNLTVGEPYPYGQFPNEDFPYLSYFFNSSFDFMGEYNTNHGRPNSTLSGGHSFFRLNLTSRCDPDYGDDYDPVYVYLGENRDTFNESIESTRVATTIRLTRSEITTSLPYDTVTRQLVHIGLASNQSFLYFTGYWAFQGMCETALRFGYGDKKKIRALTFAANTSLVLGNLVDMTTNLQNICGATQGTSRDPVDLIVQGSICAYDLMNMASEISRLVIPVTSRSSRIANEVFSNIPSSLKKMGRRISGKITNLCNGYRKNARKFNQNVVSIGFIASSIVTATSIGGALLCDKISHSILPNVYYLAIESAVVSAFSFFFPHE